MKKVTELTKANEIKNEDILMIVQNGENKQITASSLNIHTYTMTFDADTELRSRGRVAVLLQSSEMVAC